MDPSSMLSASPSSSSSLNGGSDYNLAEIWPFPLTGGGESSGRKGQLGAGFGDMGTGSGVRVSVDESIVTDYSVTNGDGSGKRRRDATASEDESSKFVYTSSGNEMQSHGSGKRMKALGNTYENGDSKLDTETSSGVGNKAAEQSNQPSEMPKQDYIHVRARRGQATDSHSLAERARREKISERMRILQDLVPGCNKVIGKAMVLDEIINYIQSLQRQVEFLSMKLEAVNSRMTPSIDEFPTKDFGAQTIDAAGMSFGSQTPREYGHEPVQEWLHMQVGGGFERPT